MQQAARVSQKTAFFHLGNLVEYGDTSEIFTNPRETRTKDYITGRYVRVRRKVHGQNHRTYSQGIPRRSRRAAGAHQPDGRPGGRPSVERGVGKEWVSTGHFRWA